MKKETLNKWRDERCERRDAVNASIYFQRLRAAPAAETTP